MVLTRAFACALPAVASDIPGLPRGADTARRRSRWRPNDPDALVDAVCELVADEPRREADGRGGAGARRRALRVAGDRARASKRCTRASPGIRRRRGARRMKTALPHLEARVGAGASSPSSRFVVALRRHLVARAGLGKRPRRVRGRHLELDRPRVPAQRRLDAVPRALVAADRRAGAAARAPTEARARPLVVRRRAARERDRARDDSASSRAWRRFVAISPMRLRGRARRSSGRSSPTACSTSCRRRSSSSGCC